MTGNFLDFLGPVVRNIPNQDNALYLTFDDGPDWSTPQVLEVLKRCDAKGTFFIVSNKATRKKDLVYEIAAAGHGIGDHSLDHRYGAFFQGKKSMLRWVKESNAILSGFLTKPTVGFRPPAGVHTPELHQVLKELHTPLVLWKKRFFDATWTWSSRRALRSLETTSPGDIILLHDRQAREKLPLFLKTLEIYIDAAKKQGFEFKALSRELCQRATIQKQ